MRISDWSSDVCSSDLISAEVRELVDDPRAPQRPQHRGHHQIADAEVAIEPVGVAQSLRKVRKPAADAIVDHWQPRVGPTLVALDDGGIEALGDRRLDRV